MQVLLFSYHFITALFSEYEISRQTCLLEQGIEIKNETRNFDENQG